MIAAGLAIVEEAGPDAFSLRAAARRAGVSPAAPAHHFRDARGLLTAIATAGFVQFDDILDAATGPDRRATIVAQCHAYLRVALERTGLFRLMWRKDMLNATDPVYLAAARRAFAISDRTVRGDDATPVLFDDPALAPTIAYWSLAHGFVGLVIDGAFFAKTDETSARLDTPLNAAFAQLEVP